LKWSLSIVLDQAESLSPSRNDFDETHGQVESRPQIVLREVLGRGKGRFEQSSVIVLELVFQFGVKVCAHDCRQAPFVVLVTQIPWVGIAD